MKRKSKINPIRVVHLTVIFLFTGQPLFAQNGKLSAKVTGLMLELVKEKNFSGTVLISKNGKIEYAKAFGYADFENKIPNNLNTKFCIGSISKVFTAAAIMKLQEQGKLNIGDKLNKYIADFPEADKISIIDLLQHTSGIKREIIDDDYESNPGTYKRNYTSIEIIDSLKKYPLDFEPGTKQNYSNGAYAVLARIVEIVSGKSYGEYLKENIFAPLKMVNTLAYNSLEPQKNTAKGYDPAPFPKGVFSLYKEDVSQNIGAGSIFSTVEDLLKWDRTIYNESVLRKSTLDTMFKYGFGFGVYTRNGKNVVGHDGIVNGYIGNMDSFIDDGVCIVFLSNIRTGVLNVLNEGLCNIYYNGKTSFTNFTSTDKIAYTQAELKKYTGVYELFPGFDLTIKEDKGVLYLKGNGGYYTCMNSLAADRFFYRSLFAEIDFELSGEKPGLIWKDISGKEYPAKKVN